MVNVKLTQRENNEQPWRINDDNQPVISVKHVKNKPGEQDSSNTINSINPRLS